MFIQNSMWEFQMNNMITQEANLCAMGKVMAKQKGSRERWRSFTSPLSFLDLFIIHTGAIAAKNAFKMSIISIFL